MIRKFLEGNSMGMSGVDREQRHLSEEEDVYHTVDEEEAFAVDLASRPPCPFPGQRPVLLVLTSCLTMNLTFPKFLQKDVKSSWGISILLPRASGKSRLSDRGGTGPSPVYMTLSLG